MFSFFPLPSFEITFKMLSVRLVSRNDVSIPILLTKSNDDMGRGRDMERGV